MRFGRNIDLSQLDVILHDRFRCRVRVSVGLVAIVLIAEISGAAHFRVNVFGRIDCEIGAF
jgi:hypothetical protein